MANVLTAVFDVEGEAYQAFSELKSFRQDNDVQIAQVALVKNEDDKITIKDSIDFDDASRDYAAIGGVTGGLLGTLSGPIGVIIGYGIGSLAGATNGSVTGVNNNSLIEEVATKLPDGDTAVITLVHGEDENILNRVFAPYKTNIIHWDTLALACEVELAGQVQNELYDKVQEDLNERRLNRLGEQGNDITNAAKTTLQRLRGKE